MKNPVKRHMHKSCIGSVEPDKKRLKQSDAILQEMSESLLNDAVGPETMCFDGIYDASCNGCLGDIGCISVSVNTFEDNYEGEK